jgi:hypothetical protein
MGTGHAQAASIVALVVVACAKPARPVEQATPSLAETTPHPSATLLAVRKMSAAVWSRPTGIACDAVLVALEPQALWNFGSVEDGITGHGSYPLGTFRLVAPEPYFGRQIGVVFACKTDDRLSPPLAEGIGHVYRLELPEDFLEGGYGTLEDCEFPRVGWVCPDENPCPPPSSP